MCTKTIYEPCELFIGHRHLEQFVERSLALYVLCTSALAWPLTVMYQRTTIHFMSYTRAVTPLWNGHGEIHNFFMSSGRFHWLCTQTSVEQLGKTPRTHLYGDVSFGDLSHVEPHGRNHVFAELTRLELNMN